MKTWSICVYMRACQTPLDALSSQLGSGELACAHSQYHHAHPHILGPGRVPKLELELELNLELGRLISPGCDKKVSTRTWQSYKCLIFIRALASSSRVLQPDGQWVAEWVSGWLAQLNLFAVGEGFGLGHIWSAAAAGLSFWAENHVFTVNMLQSSRPFYLLHTSGRIATTNGQRTSRPTTSKTCRVASKRLA